MAEPRALAPGVAAGPALVLDAPLSLWGGIDPVSGRIVDVHHPQRGSVVTGTVLVMPSGRGSSSSSTVLAESIRLGTAPVAFVLREPDAIVALGAIVARELYGIEVPVVLSDIAIGTGTTATVTATGNAAIVVVG
jgi:uncharacterized protein